MKLTKAIFIAGGLALAYYFAEVTIIGYAAALVAPSWLFPAGGSQLSLRLAVWDMLSIVPIFLILGALAGYGVARLFDSYHFYWGLAVVVTSTVVGALHLLYLGFQPASWLDVYLPESLWHVPRMLIAYVALSAFAWVFFRFQKDGLNG